MNSIKSPLEMTEVPILVALCDYPDLPDRERIAAEARYVRSLGRQLGDHETIAEMFSAVCAFQEGDQEEASPETIALVKRWAKVTTTARQAGYQGMAESEGSYFEVRLV